MTNSTKISFLIVFLISGLFQGCATQGDVEALQAQTRRDRQALQHQYRELENNLATKIETTSSPVQERQADLWAEVAAIKQNIASISGELDDINYRLNALSQKDENATVTLPELAVDVQKIKFALEHQLAVDLDEKRQQQAIQTQQPQQDVSITAAEVANVEQQALDPTVANIETAPIEIAPLDTAPASTAPVNTAPEEMTPNNTARIETSPAGADPLAPENTAQANTAQAEAVSVNTAPTHTTPANTVPAPSAPLESVSQTQNTEQVATPQLDPAQILYEKAYENFGKRKYDTARSLWAEFTTTFTDHALVPNAIFWQGECWYQLVDYQRAILAYQDVIKKYPKSTKYKYALLKQGVSFYRLGKADLGKIVLEDLISKYPESTEATRAKQYINEN